MIEYGSYTLGVSGKNSDIDAVLVVSGPIYRSHFNNIFYEMLRKRPEISSINFVTATAVPVIKTVFNNIEVNFSFIIIYKCATVKLSNDTCIWIEIRYFLLYNLASKVKLKTKNKQ